MVQGQEANTQYDKPRGVRGSVLWDLATPKPLEITGELTVGTSDWS